MLLVILCCSWNNSTKLIKYLIQEIYLFFLVLFRWPTEPAGPGECGRLSEGELSLLPIWDHASCQWPQRKRSGPRTHAQRRPPRSREKLPYTQPTAWLVQVTLNRSSPVVYKISSTVSLWRLLLKVWWVHTCLLYQIWYIHESLCFKGSKKCWGKN